MQGLLIFAGFILVYKFVEYLYSGFQLYLQYRLERITRENQPESVEAQPEAEKKEIGFETMNAGMVEVEED